MILPVKSLPDFMKENHHEIFSLLSENCYFFLFCNCEENCISLCGCLSKFLIYFVCQIQDFLTVCLIKFRETITERNANFAMIAKKKKKVQVSLSRENIS